MRNLILLLSLLFLAFGCKNKQEPKPDEPNYVRQGYYHLDKKRFEQAEQSFQNALEAGQDSSRSYIGLSLVKTRSFPEDSASFYVKNFEAAIPDLTKAIQLDSLNPYGYALRGEAKFYSNNFEGAVEDYKNLVVIAPNNAGSYFFLGKALFQKGDYRVAIDTLTKSIQIDSLTQAFVTRGQAYQELNAHKEACSDFKTAMQLGQVNIRNLMIESCSK